MQWRIMKLLVTLLTLSASIGRSTSAQSASAEAACREHYVMEGSRFIGAQVFRTYQVFPTLARDVALEHLAQGLAVDGWHEISVNKDAGIVSALQHKGESNPPITMAVKQDSSGTRVDVAFRFNSGRLPKDRMKDIFCKVLGLVEGGK